MDIVQEEKSKKIFYRTIFIGLFLLFVTLSFWAGFSTGKNSSFGDNNFTPLSDAKVINKTGENESVDFSLFWKAYDKLKEKYVDTGTLNSQSLLYGSIKGLMQATGDPYTVYLDPEENRRFNQEIEGSFEGIGAEMGIKGGILTIIAPLDDSPAQKSGLRAGDKVLKIEDKSSNEFSLDEAVSKIRGPKGSEVKLTIWRNGDEEAREIKIMRDKISVKSVSYSVKDDTIAYVKISRFSEDTDLEFNKAANEIYAKKLKGIIIDVRNNPGGYLDAAISIAGKMLPRDKIVVIEESGSKEQRKLLASGNNILGDLPVVMLINEGSASASEILAGALKDNRGETVLVGKKTFGKGSVQELVALPDNTAAKITVARWLTPSGKQINNEGIGPDIEIGLSDEDFENDRDPQLDKALETIKGKI